MVAVLGIVHLDLNIVQADSLKSKRRVVKGFRDRVADRYNVSVAEVDRQDDWQRAVLAIAMVGSDRRHVESSLQKIVNMASTHRDMILISREIEWF